MGLLPAWCVSGEEQSTHPANRQKGLGPLANNPDLAAAALVRLSVLALALPTLIG